MRKNKRQKQIDTANMTKCSCGNVAGLNQTKCGACRDKENAPGLHITGTRLYFRRNDGSIIDLVNND